MLEQTQFSLDKLVSSFHWSSVLRIAVLVFAVMPLIHLAAAWTRRFFTRKSSPQHGMIAGRIIHYGGYALICVSILNELGFSLAPLLGAAGIVGVALGFASQTSVSNIISGVFLLAERPFVIGDAIKVGDVTGQVLSIDFLSIKLRTFDNRFVRIPNETIIKSEVTNITYFPIRRVDITITVAPKEDVNRVRSILLDCARLNPKALQEPEPIVVFNGFGRYAHELMFAVWAEKTEWLDLKNSLQDEIKRRFESEGIQMNAPHMIVLHQQAGI